METVEASSDDQNDGEDLSVDNQKISDDLPELQMKNDSLHTELEVEAFRNQKISEDLRELQMKNDSLHAELEVEALRNQKISEDLRELQMKNDSLLAEFEALRIEYQSLQSKSAATEENLILLQQQNDEALKHNNDLVKDIEVISGERDALRKEFHGLEVSSREREDELLRKIDEELREKEDVQNELEGSRERIKEFLDEKSVKIRAFSEYSESLRSVKECLVRVIESMDEDKMGSDVDEGEELKEELGLDEEWRVFSVEVKAVSKLSSLVESKLSEYQETRKKEKKELENSVVSLTEENRDINSLLRIALVEKESVEKSLNRLKGHNEQKKGAILQIAERGLQKVGFGFMMGTGTNEPSLDNSGANNGGKSDGSECEEEVVSLASTVERIMKNLRLEITQLRTSLEESRSDTERLQSLTEKQAQKISENTLYIKELEDRETLLAQHAEELLLEIKETEEEVARWRQACELEVEAGKNVIEDRDKVASVLKQELEKTKAALDISNGKLKLKEELAAAAMAAQAAAERSLQLADSRAAELRVRIEELTRQLEEAESRERNHRKVRHICWPWRVLKVNPANNTDTRVQRVRRMLPEMQALLHYNV
ncbi:hypothetical protein F0562_026621 [Nyssa sinensis]|uniref:Uncharacterized protein n=1 Tax=Nyssa sinensis TaxID=561372 RepID=A0A5J5BB83_9ASTE|nr:hypothetical protein F0562_026621 [Nyssa sinensis]